MTGEMLATYNEAANKEITEPLPRLRWYEEEPVSLEVQPTESLDWIYDKWSSSSKPIYRAGSSLQTSDSGVELAMSQRHPEIFWCSGSNLSDPFPENQRMWGRVYQSPLKRFTAQVPSGSYRNPITIRAIDGTNVFIVHRVPDNLGIEASKELEELGHFSLDIENQDIYAGESERPPPRGTWHPFGTSSSEYLPKAELTQRHILGEQATAFATTTPPGHRRRKTRVLEADEYTHWAENFARVFTYPDPDAADKPLLHPIVEAFSKGFEGTVPNQETLQAATLIVESAISRAAGADIEVDETDGSIAIQLRSEAGLLVVGEYSVKGELQANIYNDKDPNPDAGIQDLWIKHLPSVSPADLVDWF